LIGSNETYRVCMYKKTANDHRNSPPPSEDPNACDPLFEDAWQSVRSPGLESVQSDVDKIVSKFLEGEGGVQTRQARFFHWLGSP
jgi:hypothetical protein